MGLVNWNEIGALAGVVAICIVVFGWLARILWRVLIEEVRDVKKEVTPNGGNSNSLGDQVVTLKTDVDFLRRGQIKVLDTLQNVQEEAAAAKILAGHAVHNAEVAADLTKTTNEALQDATITLGHVVASIDDHIADDNRNFAKLNQKLDLK